MITLMKLAAVTFIVGTSYLVFLLFECYSKGWCV